MDGTMTEQHAEHTDLIAQVMAAYEITDYQANFVRHNENVTYQVIDNASGLKYLLRIHEPVSSNLRGIQHTFEGLSGEMEYLVALAQGTCLKLQRPVKNITGSPITVVHDLANGRSPMATLLTWVDGITLDRYGEDPSALIQKVGSLAAEMHAFAQSWQEPLPFIRPVYDTRKYRHLVNRLAYGVNLGLFDAPTYAVIGQTMDKIAGILDPIAKTREHWGIIHADLKGDNLIVSSSEITPIDFSFSGYGYTLFDIGGCLASLKPYLRTRLLQGYEQQRPLSEADLQVIRCCFLLSIFGGFAFSMTNPQRHEWINRRLPVIAAGYCTKFLRGEEFMFE